MNGLEFLLFVIATILFLFSKKYEENDNMEVKEVQDD